MSIIDVDVHAGSPDPVAAAAERIYRAECALHAAFQAHEDSWVAAAYDRLHEAILEHSAALASAA